MTFVQLRQELYPERDRGIEAIRVMRYENVGSFDVLLFKSLQSLKQTDSVVLNGPTNISTGQKNSGIQSSELTKPGSKQANIDVRG